MWIVYGGFVKTGVNKKVCQEAHNLDQREGFFEYLSQQHPSINSQNHLENPPNTKCQNV